MGGKGKNKLSFHTTHPYLRYRLPYLLWNNFRVSFELEPGAVGNTTDFTEANKRMEWGLKKARISSPPYNIPSHSLFLP